MKQIKLRLGRWGLIILLLLIFSFLIMGAASTITSFKGQTNPFNATLEAETNNTQYIRIPRYAYAQNITMIIEGIEVS